MDWPKLKVFAEDKIDVVKKIPSLSWWSGNILGKGKNAGNQHFLLLLQIYKTHTFRVVKNFRLCGKGLNKKTSMIERAESKVSLKDIKA